jgi:hypothetical protein
LTTIENFDKEDTKKEYEEAEVDYIEELLSAIYVIKRERTKTNHYKHN